MTTDQIPTAEFGARRAKLGKALGQSTGLIFAGEHDSHDGPYRPHRHFEYLTGITDEPGAVLLLDPSNPVEARRDALFLRPLNPEVEKWDGYRLEVSAALRAKTGFKTIFRIDKLGLNLLDATRRSKSLSCLHPLAQHTQAVSPDLAMFRQVAERVPGTSIHDRSDELAFMRSVKSKAEVGMLQHAIDITATGIEMMMKSLRAGLNEFDVQETLEHAYRTRRSKHTSFQTIAGGGVNSTVLHYHANDQPLADGDLICVDTGAKWQGYSADITRTLPVNGRFSKRQREVYEIVLKAELAAIKAVRSGARLSQIDAAARKVIADAGYGDYFIHGIGHHLGLDTHDITPTGDLPLKEGAVITIEPGIYIPAEKIGIRVEDDVLVTKSGSKVLSAKIPKTIAELEAVMRGR